MPRGGVDVCLLLESSYSEVHLVGYAQRYPALSMDARERKPGPEVATGQGYRLPSKVEGANQVAAVDGREPSGETHREMLGRSPVARPSELYLE